MKFKAMPIVPVAVPHHVGPYDGLCFCFSHESARAKFKSAAQKRVHAIAPLARCLSHWSRFGQPDSLAYAQGWHGAKHRSPSVSAVIIHPVKT